MHKKSQKQLHFSSKKPSLSPRLDHLPKQDQPMVKQIRNLILSIGSGEYFVFTTNSKMALVKGLEQGNYKVKDLMGRSLLYFVAGFGTVEQAQFLLGKGLNVNEISSNGETPLHMASRFGNLEMVKFLISKGADPLAETTANETPLYYAIEGEHLDVVKLLLEYEDVNRGFSWGTYLHLASRLGNAEIVKSLIEKGANVNARNNLGKTPLHYAIESCDVETTKVLLENRAKPNVFDNNGKAPIHYVAELGNMELMELLIERGANVNARTYPKDFENYLKNRNSLKEVLRYWGSRIMGLLEKAGATVELYYVNQLMEEAIDIGLTPLHIASRAGNFEMVKYLVAKGANINAQDLLGRTPLHHAVIKDHNDIIDLLISNGASVRIKDRFGKKPFDYEPEVLS